MFDLFRLGLVSFQRGIYRNTYSSSRRTRRQPATGPSTSAENVGAVNRIVVSPPEHTYKGGSELRRSSRVLSFGMTRGKMLSYICWMYNSFIFGCFFFCNIA